MKDNLSDQNSEIIKRMLYGLEAIPEYDFGVESKIMDRIEIEVDHSLIVQKYKRWSKFGFILNIGLLIFMVIYTLWTIINSNELELETIGIQHFLPSFFTLIGLSLIFVQMELKKRTNEFH